jgi:alkaline phosphatase
MFRRKRIAVAIGAVIVLGIASTQLALGAATGKADEIKSGGKAHNVIYFLGDGMGVQEITAARYYQYGAAGKMNIDKLLFTGFKTTWSLKPGASPYKPDYDPDSASTGTMWATGQKTIDERISQGPSSAETVLGTNLKTVLEIAQEQGKRTGNVSTAEITDATPAVLDSHISLRGCQGPANMATCPLETKAAGGLGSIAEQTVDHHVDVVLGGGRSRFTATINGGPDNGHTVEESADRQGYTEVTTAAGLAGLDGDDLPVLGLFTSGTMNTEWSGPIAQRGGTGQPHGCTANPGRLSTEPSLADMTRKALDLLDSPKPGNGAGSDPGFFLQVEGASIDKQDHAANACAQIGETVAFDQAIGVALEYQASHPDTLIVVTADHSHTSQIVAEDSTATGNGNPTGYWDDLTTKDGQTMRIAYGTAGAPGLPSAPPSQQHTGAVVPVWAFGPGAAGVLGTTDHTDTFALLQGS